MTGRRISRSEQLEALLDEAFDLDAAARERFLGSVESDLRADLVELLRADAIPSPLDHGCSGLVEVVSAISGSDRCSSTVSAGQQTGAYRLLRLLGEGGMASVWLAERTDGHFSHQVAVKCLKTGLATPEIRARFMLEQQIMAQLQHPYIARLYDAGVTGDNVPFIVMEWIDGVSLTRYCDERRLGLTQRLQLFLKVCSAVAHAHQNLIVHRDLKPANILVGADGEPRLLDFGIAKLLDESAPVTRSGMHMLTPEYAAPEQFNGGTVTTATDGYMLGAVLYELLCGLRSRLSLRPGLPADAAVTAPSEALRRMGKTVTVSADPLHPEQIAARRGSMPERLCKALRGDLDTIVLKALQPEADRRYATVQAFSEDIQSYLRQQPISARKDARMYLAGKFLQRHAIGVAVGACVVVALLTATTVSVYQARRAQTEATRALATKEFLTDLFEVSDAGVPRDQMPSTQTLLQDAAKRIRGEFVDAPDVKVDLLLMLGRIQLHLGQYASAESLIGEAHDIANARFPPASSRWLQAQTAWAEVMRERSYPAQAAGMLDAAIGAHRRADATDSDDLVQALVELSAIDMRLEKADPSVVAARQAVAMAKRLHGDHDPTVQQALENLGRTLQSAGRENEAVTVLRANLALSGELYGTHKAKYAGSLNALAGLLGIMSKYQEEERLARQALAIDDSVFDHPNKALIDSLFALDASLYEEGKLDESAAVIQRWLAAQTLLKGDDDPSLIPPLIHLASADQDRHLNSAADGVVRRALAILARRPGSVPNWMEAAVWQLLANGLIQQRRLPEAEAAVQNALKLDLQAYEKSGTEVAIDLTYEARVEMEMGHLQPALAHIDAALGNLAKSPPSEDLDSNEVLVQKGAILNRLGRYQDSMKLLDSQVAVLRTLGSDFDIRDRLGKALVELGRAQAGNADIPHALASWDEAMRLQQAMQHPDPDQISDLRDLIAQARTTARISKKNDNR